MPVCPDLADRLTGRAVSGRRIRRCCLFGCPPPERVLDGFQEVTPLADGWSGRVGVHQPFPLLVHAVLSGRGYAEQALAVVRSALEG